MKKAMISQPMAGKTDEEIAEARDRARAELEAMGYEFVNTMFTDEWYSDEAMEERGVVQVPLCYLAKSLENMSKCHAAYFCKGWENARGCRIEHDAAVAYGLEVLYEGDFERREIAATMRAVSRRGVKDLTLGEVLNSILTGGAPRPTTAMAILERLADLIDPEEGER